MELIQRLDKPISTTGSCVHQTFKALSTNPNDLASVDITYISTFYDESFIVF